MGRLLGMLVPLALATLGLAQEAPDTISNGGMEGDYQTGLPPGWVSNCYGENKATFRADRETPHSGQAALLVECTDFAFGGVQFRCPGQSVVEGRPYTLSLWLKGSLKGQVWVGLRKHGEPYTAYLMRYVRVSPEWRRYTILGDAKGTDPDCGVYLMFAETGRLYVDDVSLRAGRYPAETASVDAPPAKGNRLYNGSFEIGTSGWAPFDGTLQAAADATAPDGHRCAVRSLKGSGLIAESRPMTLRAGQVHTFSVWLKASQPKTRVRLELVEYADAGGDNAVDRSGFSREVEVGPEWSRQSVTGVAEADFTVGYLARLHALTSAQEVGLDAAQVEEGPLSDYAPASAVEAAVYVAPFDRYPAPGGRVPVSVQLASQTPLPEKPRVRLALVDLWGAEAGRQEVLAQREDDRHASGAASVAAPGPGLYRLVATAEPGPSAPGEAVIGVLPSPSSVRPDPSSFFGSHAPPILAPHSLNLGPKIALRSGARWHRIHDFACYVQWHFVQPQPDRWVWADEEVNYLRSLGYEFLGTLARTPPWAAKPGKEHALYGDWTSAPPRDLAEFATYVRRTVEHYKDRIHTWEIWNEPYGSGFFSGTPEEYAEVLKAGYTACKQADPTCTVLGLCCYPGLPDWVDRVLAAAGTESMDALSYHTYFGPGYVAERSDGGPPMVVRDVERLRELMAKHGRVKPIWHTEGGVACPTSYSWLPPDGWPCTPREAAATYTKCVVLMMAADVQRWCYYFVGWAWGGRGDYYLLLNTPYVQLDCDSSPKATLLAQSAAAQLLDRARFVREASTPDLRAYLFQRGRDAVAVLWAKKSNPPVKLPPPKPPLRALNMMAAPIKGEGQLLLTTDPLYVVAPGKSAAELARAMGLAQR